jgi:hypothetical protein
MNASWCGRSHKYLAYITQPRLVVLSAAFTAPSDTVLRRYIGKPRVSYDYARVTSAVESLFIYLEVQYILQVNRRRKGVEHAWDVLPYTYDFFSTL